ncbi:MAG TPA: phosphotransferase, partial [Nitrolancea sp.]|nr:phosphotransferase [Nitrolancea sp.]
DAPSDVADLTGQLAQQLAAIHGIDAARHDLTFLRSAEEAVAHTLRQATARSADPLERRIRDVLAAGMPPSRNWPVLLHGDYWPGNALWRHGRLAAIIDWEDAAAGDPLADLANSRLELLWACGEEAMRLFTLRYLALTSIDATALPAWDLWAALRPLGRFEDWAPDAAARATLRDRHRWFVEQALPRL